MKLKDIFTEYDKSLEKKLNLDPLGMGVIWTYFGQEIFLNKISSSTSDVRSFNLNLFNHFVIKSLMDKGTNEIKNLFEKDKKETIEKLIILLENMLIWSWHKDSEGGKRKNGWERKNLLGTAKAISIWQDNVKINTSLESSMVDLELLKGQKSVGVNGRYKGSFIHLGFFDSSYNDYFDNKEAYQRVEKLITDTQPLNVLYEKVMEFFKSFDIDKIPMDAYNEAFSKTKNLASYTEIFWLENLGFKVNEAQIIYDTSKKGLFPQEIYQQAYSSFESEKFELILQIEPKLSYLETLFNYLLFHDGVEVSELEENEFFKSLEYLDFNAEYENAKDSAKYRLEELKDIDSIETLLAYHKNVMEERGYVAWLKIKYDGTLSVDM